MRGILLRLAGVGVLLGFWQLMAVLLPPSRLVGPWNAVSDLVHHYNNDPLISFFGFSAAGYGGLMYFTVRNVIVGVAVGGLCGVVGGVALARTERTRAATEPALVTLGTVPILAVMPLFVIWFGVASYTSVILVALYTTILLAQYAMRAAENLPPIYEARAKTCGARMGTRVIRVLVPGVMPEILGGLRVALAFSWGLEVFAETLGAPSGLGQGIQILSNTDNVQGILAIVLLIAAVALLVDALLMAAARLLFRWR
ncbi:MAG: ABC transporter permease subunit [Actinomycetota bacterium]|nr:ABC transporter permease subunit [Actinomycetota bacterium]